MKRVLITAGASGIGRAMGDAFDAAGYKVWVTDLDEVALAGCPDSWEKSAVSVQCVYSWCTLYDTVKSRWGGVDAVMANAGIAGPNAPVEDVELEDWRQCISVNLEGAFLAAKHMGPMLKESRGSMVLTSSTAGLYGYPNRSPYCAAKWAVIGLMKTLAMEWGPHGARANVVCPGSVDGPRMEGVLAREAAAKNTTPDVIRKGYANGTSMQTWVQASDIADMAVFLSSPQAGKVSGQVISVDGHTVNPDPQV